MNARPATPTTPAPRAPEAPLRPSAVSVAPRSVPLVPPVPPMPPVPRNGGRSRTALDAPADPCASGDTLGPFGHPDPLDHPDPATAADSAAVDALLRCWVREHDVDRPPGPCLQLPLATDGNVLHVPVRYWSATGRHRFGAPTLLNAPDGAPALDAVTLAALLGREAAHSGGRGSAAGLAGLVGRVADSVRRTAVFVEDRRARPADPADDALFLHGEQASFLGHPWHPAPQSREGFSAAESPRYAPECRGGFPLHWLAVHRSVLAADSAWTERGRPVEAATLAARLLPAEPGPRLPPDTVPLPLHPWQARDVRCRPAVAELLDAGLLHDLGPHGAPWYATSSVRTVHRPDAPVMIKLALGVRLAGRTREPSRAELRRGVALHRLLRGGLAERWRAACPGGLGSDVVRDPAWLAVDAPGGGPVPGLAAVLRHNPFGPGDDAVCLAGLTSLRPWPGRTAPAGHPAVSSRLAETVHGLARRTGRPVPVIAVEWFLRYLGAVVRPLLWLDGEAGVVLAAHQQNTLVLLDRDGWPVGGRYRGGQHAGFRESARDALTARLPALAADDEEAFLPDGTADERFAHHLGCDNVLGLIGAFGSRRLADERILLAAFRRFLAHAATGPGATRSSLPRRLLDAPTLRCPAHLLGELAGDGAGPPYVTIANPLAGPG
ncbi:IucA/IucC family protein [Streptomyces sp. NPDC021100]|uniref:IucA/IucC family protein n=1 Tax=Streptomyces sp. NPDC021100 TaxID=3365114 RepID=UPI003787F393